MNLLKAIRRLFGHESTCRHKFVQTTRMRNGKISHHVYCGICGQSYKSVMRR